MTIWRNRRIHRHLRGVKTTCQLVFKFPFLSIGKEIFEATPISMNYRGKLHFEHWKASEKYEKYNILSL